ncbi:hypothetical protein EGR_03678 [Echinococcus granulosus]|uniref:Uncharacterized protein n=1 Tax=Echinococcus granulosus TaxID=6210 RepID=W6UJZ1_ECHGR|nr:hypothetical protein EGR_03678 [Echinococcus granulosus]EUB61388.1 hypothetical protein EGR_03678 [Echinococcus granulosus]
MIHLLIFILINGIYASITTNWVSASEKTHLKEPLEAMATDISPVKIQFLMAEIHKIFLLLMATISALCLALYFEKRCYLSLVGVISGCLFFSFWLTRLQICVKNALQMLVRIFSKYLRGKERDESCRDDNIRNIMVCPSIPLSVYPPTDLLLSMYKRCLHQWDLQLLNSEQSQAFLYFKCFFISAAKLGYSMATQYRFKVFEIITIIKVSSDVGNQTGTSVTLRQIAYYVMSMINVPKISSKEMKPPFSRKSVKKGKRKAKHFSLQHTTVTEIIYQFKWRAFNNLLASESQIFSCLPPCCKDESSPKPLEVIIFKKDENKDNQCDTLTIASYHGKCDLERIKMGKFPFYYLKNLFI